MALTPLTVTPDVSSLLGDVRRLLREAERRVIRLRRTDPVPAFVPSDFGHVDAILRGLDHAGVPAVRPA